MKIESSPRFVLAVLVSIRFASALGFGTGLRGETAQTSKASADLEAQIHQLKAENEALKKRNMHLEVTQGARADLGKSRRTPSQDNSIPIVGAVEVVNQEMFDLRKKLEVAEADKKELVQALRQMLAKNSTQLFKKQAEKTQQQKLALELKCGRERQALEAQLKEAQTAAQKTIAEAKDKCDDAKELAKTLQEQNVDLQKQLRGLQSEFSKTSKMNKDLSSDKANLVATMHALMRETSKFKQELTKEEVFEARQAKELASDEAKLAKLKPKPKPVQKKPVKLAARKAAKKGSPHKREESMAAQMAHLKAINHYIIKSQTEGLVAEGDDAEAEGAEPRQQLVRTAVISDDQGQGLREWLGLKVPPKPKAGAIPKDANGMSPIDALDPEAVKKEKKAEAQKKEQAADDGGDEIGNLLKQAKDQLQAMDAVDN